MSRSTFLIIRQKRTHVHIACAKYTKFFHNKASPEGRLWASARYFFFLISMLTTTSGFVTVTPLGIASFKVIVWFDVNFARAIGAVSPAASASGV